MYRNNLKYLFLSTESLRPGKGGISRVARLMAKVIVEEQGQMVNGLKALSLSDTYPVTEFVENSKTVKGSYLKYILFNNLARVKYNYFLYDFLGVMRSHNILPFLPKRPSLVWAHGIEVWENALPCHIANLRHADYVLFNSNYTKKKVESLHGQLRNSHVCLLSTETDDGPREVVPYYDRKPVVLIVARMEKGRDKGHRSLIRSWSYVIEKIPDARLKIVGQGNDKENIKEIADKSSAGNSIDFLGFVSDETLDDLYNNARLFAMPSRGEGFGIVYIEAMKHGLPVVGSVYDAAREVIEHGKTGLTIDSDRDAELAGAIIELLSNPEKARYMGEQGFHRWRKYFSYSSFKDRFITHLNEFISKN